MPAEAPYLRIVAEIRERIAVGRLRPGEKIPSTRQITQEWGVAMATATKVISTLRDEGVVDTRPGAGTVVRSAPADPMVHRAPGEQDLTRDRIVRVATAIADAEGLPAVSMRRVAMELGASTMSLYRHVSSKDELVLYMGDLIVGEAPFPPRPAGWRASLETVARHLWQVCRRHHWMSEVFSMTRPRAAPNLFMYSEWVLGVLLELGLPINDMMYIHLNLISHIRGMALTLAMEDQARQDSGLTTEEWFETIGPEFIEVAASGRYPVMLHITTLDFDQDLDEMFEYGLRLLLDGVAQRLSR
ncbi:TetR/AcrR family transcriptional regulator C-terminal domain-containing protein [Actinocrispum wychmicini]|uniref:TetR family transcriptional regulator n=1 Tax=Actinocrispum wychmicini TaxID=1213861 RepID=A0A4R2J667_9PSEU|nr:TetR/AcrR family transcriptional regulator C-terminal domain-containing protein [Actinocrispum wychmicini]TCO50645.1 TetR family transcriptional regulator [Actinocrispum wychmicini]